MEGKPVSYGGIAGGNYGPWMIHPKGDGVKPWPRNRVWEAFHIHGNWGPPYSPKRKPSTSKTWFKEPIPDGDYVNGEVYWSHSVGCIILHRSDLLDLKAKWEKYVLHGEEHGPASVGVPLWVKYADK